MKIDLGIDVRRDLSDDVRQTFLCIWAEYIKPFPFGHSVKVVLAQSFRLRENKANVRASK
jgi:hypothetical protein